MIHIIEGADGTGKTTYALREAEMGAGLYLHAGPPVHDTWGAEYIDPIANDHDYVLDRWHVGELVWSTLFGRPSLFRNARDFSNCCKAISLLTARVTIVVRDEDGIRQTLEERGEGDQIELVLEGQRLYQMIADTIPHLPVSVVHSDVLWRSAVTHV